MHPVDILSDVPVTAIPSVILQTGLDSVEPVFRGTVDRALIHKSQHIENISLEGAAAHFRYHPKYFSSLLKKQTGKGFQSLVSELRLKKASNLLKYTSLTIDEVALAVGYANASSFYGIFKDEYGCTPGDYRKR